MTQPYDEPPVAPASADDVPIEEPPVEEPPVEDAEVPTDDTGFGDPRVDDAVARLQQLSDRPVGEHAEIFDDIHRRLREALEEAAVEPVEEPRG